MTLHLNSFTHWRRFICAVSFAVFLAAFPHDAVADSSAFTFKLRGMTSGYERTQGTSFFDNVSTITLRNPIAFELAGEYRLHQRFGLELSVGRSQLRGRYTVARYVPDFSTTPPTFTLVEHRSTSGRMALATVSLAPMAHYQRESRFDIYGGPQLSLVRFSDDFDAPSRSSNSSLGFGITLGAIRFISDTPWAAGIELRHTRIPYDLRDQRELYRDLNMTFLGLVIARTPQQ